ncbi:peroxisomal-coenzyme A synthetase [Mizuhopecten yessoensis]|uniref:Peroxisomal-coenzyme A synthetase n=2 Tax=Mizuhopecten yessoensis TaxID=6573 RepID=A0A210QS71_MIZYE|nr:peroxisomal-coenzyme A synthetase [Mizuhopecten yessoensis]
MKGPIERDEPLEAGDVGLPYSGVELRVVDRQELPIERGCIGRIQIRSPQQMKEYVGCPQLTKAAFTGDRWFRTGDIGELSSNGHLILLGRETDAISRGTRKIYPGMLEFLLKKMKSMKDVCVLPVPDKRLYEEIYVCFVPSGQITPEDVQQNCRQNLFTEHTLDTLGEMPMYFLQFKIFPKIGNGKSDKKAIRVEATQRLGLAVRVSDNQFKCRGDV